jgi:hypothetical protein
MKKTIAILYVSVLALWVSGPTAKCAVNDYNPFNVVYGLSDQHQQMVKECIDEGERMVGILRQSNRTAEADELSAMLSGLRQAKYSNGFSVLDMGSDALQAMGLSASDRKTYGYVYTSFQKTIHLTGEFYDIDRGKLKFTGALSVIRLEQLSVLLHELKHTDYQGMLDLAPRDREAYAVQLKWLRIFDEFTPTQPGLSWNDLELPNKVETWLKDQGVDTSPKPTADACRQKYATLEKTALDGLPNFPTGADSRDRKKIEIWRDASLKYLDPAQDGPREANRVECLAEVERIHGDLNRLYCRTCKQVTTQYWFAQDSDLGPHWMCQCSTVTQIADLKRADGKTYREYARERIAAVDRQKQEVSRRAETALQQAGK